jgi:hypothetical protein
MTACQPDVRFTPESGHVRCNLGCLLCARSGHSLSNQTARIAWPVLIPSGLISNSARGSLHYRRSTKRDRCGSPPTAIPLRSAENTGTTLWVIVRRSVRLMMVPPNNPAMRPITDFAGKRLFVTAGTVDEHHTCIFVHGVTVCPGVQTTMPDNRDRPRGSLSPGQVILVIMAIIVLLIFAWSHIR